METSTDEIHEVMQALKHLAEVDSRTVDPSLFAEVAYKIHRNAGSIEALLARLSPGLAQGTRRLLDDLSDYYFHIWLHGEHVNFSDPQLACDAITLTLAYIDLAAEGQPDDLSILRVLNEHGDNRAAAILRERFEEMVTPARAELVLASGFLPRSAGVH